jgi:uncharacterized protein DUF5995
MQFSYDDQLAALISNDVGSIDAVAGALQAMDAILDGSRDGLKWFNTLYLQVTLAVEQRVAQNDFGDPEGASFIANLDFVFADLYFAALRAWLSGGNPPESWRVMLEQRADPAVARIQFALAGVNAHINRDLMLAVVKTCGQAGIKPLPATVQYQAYTALNPTLDSLIEAAKRELMVSLPGDALPGADRVQEVVASWSVAAARESAWVNAEILSTVGSEAGLSARFIETVDGTAALAGKALLVV